MPEHNGLDGKLMTVGEAVGRFVHDGDQICVGGFTINRNPMAVVYEIARRRIRDLHLVAHSNGQALDVLVGAGCVRRLDIAYGGNGRFAPTCIRFRKAVERGELQVEDYTNNMMSLRFLAGALNIPFIPSKSGLGTDVVERSGFPPELRSEDGVPCEKVIVIDDPFASADHAMLTYRGRSWYVEDLGSTNGTYLNGRVVSGVAALGYGDELAIGQVRLRLERARSA